MDSKLRLKVLGVLVVLVIFVLAAPYISNADDVKGFFDRDAIDFMWILVLLVVWIVISQLRKGHLHYSTMMMIVGGSVLLYALFGG